MLFQVEKETPLTSEPMLEDGMKKSASMKISNFAKNSIGCMPLMRPRRPKNNQKTNMNQIEKACITNSNFSSKVQLTHPLNGCVLKTHHESWK